MLTKEMKEDLKGSRILLRLIGHNKFGIMEYFFSRYIDTGYIINESEVNELRLLIQEK